MKNAIGSELGVYRSSFVEMLKHRQSPNKVHQLYKIFARIHQRPKTHEHSVRKHKLMNNFISN